MSRMADDLKSIDIAFFSRDLYEGSSLRAPGVLSDAFFRIANAAPNLRWLHVCSTGLDLPQYRHTLTKGVRITASTGVAAVPIAQTVVAAIMAQERGFDHWLRAQARQEWAPLSGANRPRELRNLRAVVVGSGAIGSEIGRLLKAVGLHVTAVRRTIKETPNFDLTIDLTQLDTILPFCDWLVLAVPLTKETTGLIDARRLSLLPSDARIANVARGELIDEDALCEALIAGKLGGAYLDTFVNEPLPLESPLWSLPQVWVSPHNSSASHGHEDRVIDSFVAQFEAGIWRDGFEAA